MSGKFERPIDATFEEVAESIHKNITPFMESGVNAHTILLVEDLLINHICDLSGYISMPRSGTDHITMITSLLSHPSLLGAIFAYSNTILPLYVVNGYRDKGVLLTQQLLEVYNIISTDEKYLFDFIKTIGFDHARAEALRLNTITSLYMMRYFLSRNDEDLHQVRKLLYISLRFNIEYTGALSKEILGGWYKQIAKELEPDTVDSLNAKIIDLVKKEPKSVRADHSLAVTLTGAMTLGRFDNKTFLDSLFYHLPASLDKIDLSSPEQTTIRKPLFDILKQVFERFNQQNRYMGFALDKSGQARRISQVLVNLNKQVSILDALSEQIAYQNEVPFISILHLLSGMQVGSCLLMTVGDSVPKKPVLKEIESKVLMNCAQLMRLLTPVSLYYSGNCSSNISNKKGQSVALYDHTFRMYSIFTAYLYYLTTNRSEEEQYKLLALVNLRVAIPSYAPIDYPAKIHILPIDDLKERLNFVCAALPTSGFSDQLRQLFTIVLNLVLKEVQPDSEITFHENDLVNDFYHGFSAKVTALYSDFKTYDERYDALMSDESLSKSKKLMAYIDCQIAKTQIIHSDGKDGTLDDEVIDSSDDESGVIEHKSSPVSAEDQAIAMQKVVFESLAQFKKMSFEEGLATSNEHLAAIERLETSAELKFMLNIDSRLQFARAMIKYVNAHAKASDIAQLPRQLLIDFEAALKTLNKTIGGVVDSRILGRFTQINDLIHYYQLVIEDFRTRHLAVRARIHAKWEEAYATGVFSGRLFEAKEPSVYTKAFRSLESADVITGDGVSEEYARPCIKVLSQKTSKGNTKKSKKGKKGKKAKRTNAVNSLVDVRVSCLKQLGQKVKQPEKTLPSFLMNQPPVTKSAAGAGAGAGKKVAKKRKQRKLDGISQKVNTSLADMTATLGEDFLSKVTIFGGALKDICLGKSLHDIDARFNGTDTEFKSHQPTAKLHDGPDGVASHAAKITINDMLWDISIHQHPIGKSHFDFNINALKATYEAGRWHVRTLDSKVIDEEFFKQAIERVSPVTLIDDPILILRALNLKAKGFTLSEELKGELAESCQYFNDNPAALTEKRRAHLSNYFGQHTAIAETEEYKGLGIAKLLGVEPDEWISPRPFETRWADIIWEDITAGKLSP